MTLHWSKTVQFWEQVVQLPLPLIPDCPLCPVIAIQQASSFIKHPLQQSQAFMGPDPATQAKSKVFLLILNSSGGYVQSFPFLPEIMPVLFVVGSISAALSCLVYPPREERVDRWAAKHVCDVNL